MEAAAECLGGQPFSVAAVAAAATSSKAPPPRRDPSSKWVERQGKSLQPDGMPAEYILEHSVVGGCFDQGAWGCGLHVYASRLVKSAAWP